jgi:hypothetical protein
VKELVDHIMAAAPQLDELAAERIARQLVAGVDVEPERPVNARAVADFLGLQKTDWVYRHARELGGFTLGNGSKPRWRFLLSEIVDEQGNGGERGEGGAVVDQVGAEQQRVSGLPDVGTVLHAGAWRVPGREVSG